MVTLRELKARVPKPGTVVAERYTLRTRLGRGGFGEVWAAEDRQAGHDIALKLFLHTASTEPLEQFKDEFQLLTTLQHPHINRVYDFGRDPTYGYYFSTELIHGTDLVAASKGKSPEYIERLIAQVLRALAFLHSRGVMHFDIKPHNILVEHPESDAPRAKLIDFGLAALTPHATKAGTPGYMAPELIVSGGPIDGRADLYAVGVTFYTCLTRRNPFRADDAQTTWENHLTFVPPSPSQWLPKVPAYLDTFIMRLLAKSPFDRPLSAVHGLRELNLLSPHDHPVETGDTEYAYLPAAGCLIGRDAERTALRGVITAMMTPSSDLPLRMLIGGSGLGKTTLLRALRYEAQLAGCTVIAFDGVDDPACDRFSERLGTLLSQPTQPTVIVIDTLDDVLADPALAPLSRLLQTVVERVQQQVLPHVGVVCAARTVPDAFPAMPCLPLSPFTRDEVVAYLTAVVPSAATQPAFLASLWQRARGNPALLHETVRALLAGGQLIDASGRWSDSQFDDISVSLPSDAIPARLLRDAETMLETQGTDSRKMLEVMAVWGDPISLTALATVAGIPPARLRAALAHAVRMGLALHDPRTQEYVIADVVMAHAVVRTVDTGQCQEWHDRIAEYVRDHGASTLQVDRHLAYGADRAVRGAAMHRLCQWERRHGQLAAAIRRLEEHVAAASVTADDSALLLLLVRLLLQADRADAALRTLQHYATLGLTSTDVSVRAMALDLAGRAALQAQDPDRARALYTRMRDDPDIMVDPCWHVRVENGIARVTFDEGQHEAALHSYRAQWEAQRRLPLALGNQVENNELGQCLLQRGEVAAAIIQLRAEIALCERGDAQLPLASRLYHLGEALRQTRVYAEATQTLHRAACIARDQQALRLLATIYNGLGNVALAQSDFITATQWYERALPLTYRLGDLDRAIVLSVNLARLHAHTTQHERAAQLLRVADVYLDGHPESPHWVRELRSAVCQLLGECARQRHDWDDATRYLERAWATAQSESVSASLCSIALTRAEVEQGRGNLPGVREWCRHVERCQRTPEEDAVYRTLLVNLGQIE